MIRSIICAMDCFKYYPMAGQSAIYCPGMLHVFQPVSVCVSTAYNNSQQLVKAHPNNVLHSSSYTVLILYQKQSLLCAHVVTAA